MKKLVIVAIVVGAILLLVGIGGAIVLSASGVSGSMLSGSMAMYDMMDMSDYIGAGNLFLIRIIQYRIAFIVVGLILVIGGIVMVRMGGSPRQPQRGYGAQSRQQGSSTFPQGRSAGPVAHPMAQRSRQAIAASPSRGSNQTLLPFREDRCCVCNRSLSDGHAVLFTNEYGAEARIDSVCYEAINTLGSSENSLEVEKALSFIRSRLKNVDPIVAKQLKKYIQSGEEFLYQAEEEY